MRDLFSFRLLCCVLAIGVLAACGGGKKDAPHTGLIVPPAVDASAIAPTMRPVASEPNTEADPVLHVKHALTVHPELAKFRPKFPFAKTNRSWPFQFIAPFTRLQLPTMFHPVGKIDTPPPSGDGTAVIAAGTYFFLAKDGSLYAYRLKDLSLLWQQHYAADFTGGTIAYADNQLVFAQKNGVIMGLDPRTGKAYWRNDIEAELASPPYIYQRHVFVTTTRNKTYGLHGNSGDIIWVNQASNSNSRAGKGLISPVGIGAFLLVPYPSGELFALHAMTGEVLWRTAIREHGTLEAALHAPGIAFTPLIYDAALYMVSENGVLNVVDIYTQEHVWAKDLGIISPPIASGRLMFAVNAEHQLFALHTRSGGIKWITDITRFIPKGTPINTMVFAGDYIRVLAKDGTFLNVHPVTGEVAHDTKLPANSHVIVMGEQLFLASEDGVHLYQ